MKDESKSNAEYRKWIDPKESAYIEAEGNLTTGARHALERIHQNEARVDEEG